MVRQHNKANIKKDRISNGVNVSIIIRTKNEERWITQCLEAILGQRYQDFEIIIVDNESRDKTIHKARQFEKRLGERLKFISCDDFLPGKALNIGIKNSKGTFIACLSGHCIPANNNWLSSLLSPFGRNDISIAGVYGRQQPMSFTSDADKRDLALLFGMDARIQEKDSFFHNANSLIRRDIWERIPFDEKTTNIEDRIWAQRVLSEKNKKYKIVYNPDASVYHYHGIHQNGDVERCTNVVKILESMHKRYCAKSIEIEKLNIVAIIPIKGEIKYLKKKPLLEYTIKRTLESRYVKKIIVSTDNAETAAFAKKAGAETPFIRDPYLSMESVALDKVFSYSLEKMEEKRIFPDLVVLLEATFPFRPKGLIDEMIVQLTENGLDSIVAARRENKAIWKEERDKNIRPLDEGLTPRKFKDPTFIELRGVGTVTHPEFLRVGKILGEKIGIYEVNDPYLHLEVRSEEDFKLASLLIDRRFK